MSAPLRLAIFDVDGTLVDSQVSILGAMRTAFEEVQMPMPGRDDVLGIVGLSLGEAMLRLVPDACPKTRDRLINGYKSAFARNRLRQGAKDSAPLYPGATAALARLNAIPDVLLGVATGKSRRGLNALLSGHALETVFLTTQVADDHPSKPHPSMIETALKDTGVSPEHAVMIGDTRFDMDMARAAGIRGIGVSWGYHPRSVLDTCADRVVDDFTALVDVLLDSWDLST
ncbi:MAG: HAD-IA family hydrolase [Arenibacterium sp.]